MLSKVSQRSLKSLSKVSQRSLLVSTSALSASPTHLLLEVTSRYMSVGDTDYLNWSKEKGTVEHVLRGQQRQQQHYAFKVVWKELRDWKSNWKKIVFLSHWCSGIQPLYLIVKQISTFLGLFQSRQGTSSQYQYCYLDLVIWYCLSAQPIQYK